LVQGEVTEVVRKPEGRLSVQYDWDLKSPKQ